MSLSTPAPEQTTEAVSYQPMASLAEWHKAVGQTRYIEEPNAAMRKKNASLRLALIREEFTEVSDELLDVINGQGDRVKLAKELADLLYVVYGTADDFEIPLQDVLNAVHQSNMTKVDETGSVQRRPDGKILKGPNYQEPDLASIVLGSLADD